VRPHRDRDDLFRSSWPITYWSSYARSRWFEGLVEHEVSPVESASTGFTQRSAFEACKIGMVE